MKNLDKREKAYSINQSQNCLFRTMVDSDAVFEPQTAV